MKSRSTAAFVLVALVCSTILISSIGFAQSAAQSPEFLASLTRVQHAERSGNDRQPPEKVMDAIGLKAGMVWVYHMLEGPVPLLKAIAPSLKAGATLVILDPVPSEVQEEFGNAPAGTKYSVPTRENIERDAALAGYEVVRAMTGFLESDSIFVLRRK